jgi:FAD/FMN-containing dehydrogenase
MNAMTPLAGPSLDLDTLRDRCSGTVTGPEDPGWDLARQAWNLAVDQRPAVVVEAESAADVAEALRCARSAGLRVAPQGTGHNATPLGSLGSTLLLRTHRLDAIEIDPVTRRARVGAGALWGQVTEAAGAHGLAPLAGSSPDVGVIGYCLGGGMSWLARRHGLACTHVTRIELVTADGEHVHCDARTRPELFWALRGGGGSFGVVTAMELTLFETPEIYAGAMLWPWERSAEVLRRWRDWTRTSPDTVSSSARMLQIPPMPDVPEPLRGRAFVAIDGAFLGDEAAGRALLEPLRELGPEMDTFAMTAPAALSHLHMDPEHPVPGLGGHVLLADARDETIDRLVAAAGPGSGSPLVSVELRQLGGAVGRPAEDGGACASIDAAFILFAVGIPMGPGAAEAVETALGRVLDAAAPEAAGHTPNFTERATTTSAFHSEATVARLRAVKALYDPEDVIQANHPVRPEE